MTEHAQLQEELIRLAVQNGAHTLDALVRQCDGIYPGELASILEDLVKCGKIVFDHDTYRVATVRLPSEQLSTPAEPVQPSQLPQPHPHDYDWRFSFGGLDCRRVWTSSRTAADVGISD